MCTVLADILRTHIEIHRLLALWMGSRADFCAPNSQRDIFNMLTVIKLFGILSQQNNVYTLFKNNYTCITCCSAVSSIASFDACRPLRGRHHLVTPVVSVSIHPLFRRNGNGNVDQTDARVATIRDSPLNNQVQCNPLAVKVNDNTPSEGAQKLSYV